MDAVEFLMKKTRFCKNADCQECVIYNECDTMFGTITRKQAEKIVDVVDKWAKEHPIKTRQSEFLKMFPNAPLYSGVIEVDPCKVDETFECKCCGDCSSKCRRDYWSQEVE